VKQADGTTQPTHEVWVEVISSWHYFIRKKVLVSLCGDWSAKFKDMIGIKYCAFHDNVGVWRRWCDSQEEGVFIA
jgi:hypothetical protein